MKELIGIYKKQYLLVESSITAILNSIDFTQYDEIVKHSLFGLSPAIKATYKINAKLKQSTPLYTIDNSDASYLGVNKSHLLERIVFREDNIYISNAYINSRTGLPYITAVLHTQNEYIVCDFELYIILKELSLIEGNEAFTLFTKYFYALFGFLLALFSLALIAYAIYSAFSIFTEEGITLLTGLFRSIIALTLALAIFDLSKTILEHEVFYKSLSRNYNLENRLLARFLTSIIIALSIEALMVVFKITLSDYSDMIHAFYLIAGVGIMIVSLSIFVFIMRYHGKK
ncbi:hypothetical protein JHD49_10865 [Sulfurimonas sp. SAG-AH-194-C21]|nr:hypothetical protein [Sulfurimonas sp. SAG-AH-194-C21]MDF1884443.1 hypothetical protein [Sulfurimonas sp. SAG-AH-194-C21]